MKTLKARCSIIVIKIASRCNINCTYCYMYNLGDGTYKNQPKVMTDEVVDTLLVRVLEHCSEHNLKYFYFVFHGGEPLLAGKEFFINFIEKANRILMPATTPLYSLQTNGILLSDSWCKTLGNLNVRVGISLDGPKDVNDQFRIDHKGNGTYDAVIKGLKIASGSSYLKKKIGILSVININSDPKDVYKHCKKIGVAKVDFLLPDRNYETDLELNLNDRSAGDYGIWLSSLFDEWFYDTSDARPNIRIFSQIIRTIMGAEIMADNMGAEENEVLVIETDGGIEAVDSLKICGHAFTKEGASIFHQSFNEALVTPLANLYYYSHKILCSKCLSCPLVEVCGGGAIAHRYRKLNGFNNPSVYCDDLIRMYTHIQNAVVNELIRVRPDLESFDLITYEQVKDYLDEEINYSSVENGCRVELEFFKR